jgi:hypothetical protein
MPLHLALHLLLALLLTDESQNHVITNVVWVLSFKQSIITTDGSYVISQLVGTNSGSQRPSINGLGLV